MTAYETRSMRALAALRMVLGRRRFGRLDGGGELEMLTTWCVRKLRGDAQPSPYRVLSVAPGRRVWRARRRRMVMNEAATCERAPVVSA
jgi:hypothetical protein